MAMPVKDTIQAYLTFGALSWYQAELISSAYNTLINAWDSELITNRALVKDLAEFYSILNSEFEDQVTSMNHINNMMIILDPLLPDLSFHYQRNWIRYHSQPKRISSHYVLIWPRRLFWASAW